MIYIKNLANAMTIFRIVGTICLCFLEPLTVYFFTLYFLCGLSDMLDGFIARKTGNTTAAGAMLDSVADFIFLSVMLIIFIPFLPWKLWIAVWIGAIALLRLVSLSIGFAKYHTAASLHTVLNKAAGFLLFAFPVLYRLTGMETTAIILCGISSLAAVEELFITIKSKSLNRDIAGYLQQNTSDIRNKQEMKSE